MEYNGVFLSQEDFDKWWAGVSEEDKNKIETPKNENKIEPKQFIHFTPDLRGKLKGLTLSPQKNPSYISSKGKIETTRP